MRSLRHLSHFPLRAVQIRCFEHQSNADCMNSRNPNSAAQAGEQNALQGKYVFAGFIFLAGFFSQIMHIFFRVNAIFGIDPVCGFFLIRHLSISIAA